MKILILAQYFPPDITAAAFRMFDTARLLETAGHKVSVITARPHRSQVDGVKVADVDAQVGRVWRTAVSPLDGAGFTHYIKHYASFMLGSTWLGLRHLRGAWKPDVIWASSPPLFVGLSGVALSWWLRVPFVLDVRDIWPESAVGTGQLTAGGRAHRFGEWMEKFIYNRAAHITCVARPMQEYIRRRTATDVTVVYNGTRAADITAGLAPKNGSTGHTLLYAGNLGRAQQLDLLLEAWAKVRRNGHYRWTMKLLGSGAVEKDLKELAAKLGVSDSVMFLSATSRPNARREMARASALSISLQANEAFDKTIPSKVFDCMAAGRPILGGIAGEGRELLESTGANPCYDPGKLPSLEAALERLLHDYDQLRLAAGKNPAVVRRAYTREQAVDVLMGVFDAVVSPEAGRRAGPAVADKDRRKAASVIELPSRRAAKKPVSNAPTKKDAVGTYSTASETDR